MARDVSVAIVGAGFGGVGAAIMLKRQGIEDVTILERGDRVGGVWRANTYPGIACDVPSHLYSFSFAQNTGWSRRFSPGDEIQAYLQDVAEQGDVMRHIRFGAEVERAEFDDAAGRWRLALAGGETVEADVFITACGQLHRPQIPAVPGMEHFRGPMFHSAHWDHDVDLTAKRVAVIGTGASAIQFVPAIAPQVERLTIFQRSAPWVITKFDRDYPERTRARHARHPWLQRIWRFGWWAWMESLVPLFVGRPRWIVRPLTPYYRAVATLQRAYQLRLNPKLMAATKPSFPLGCKRILITNDWYRTLRRKNVDVVSGGVAEVTEDAIVAPDGSRHEADAIIFGTGFAATEFLAPMEVVGRGGRRLDDAWAKGAEAYLGITVPEFPNLFLLYGPNTNHGTGSALAMLEAEARYAVDAVKKLAGGEARRLEVRREVHDAFQRELEERLKDTVWTGCSSWYVTADGRVTNNWPGSQTEYRRRTRQVALDEYLTEAPRPVPAAV